MTGVKRESKLFPEGRRLVTFIQYERELTFSSYSISRMPRLHAS
jgi:hypothetical protein